MARGPYQCGSVQNTIKFGELIRCPFSKNAKTLISSKTDLVAKRATGFNSKIELKNIILRRDSIFEFSHMG